MTKYYYKLKSIGMEIVLERSPCFGDTYSLDTMSISRRLRGGALRAYRHFKWPTITTVQLYFKNLSEQNISDLRVFLEQTAGMIIEINPKYTNSVDLEEDYVKGYITDDEHEITAMRRQSDYECDLSFFTVESVPHEAVFYFLTEDNQLISDEGVNNTNIFMEMG